MWAGARSLFLAPKITDIQCFQRLAKTFHLKADLPRNLKAQGPLLVELALAAGANWEAEIVIVAIPQELFKSACGHDLYTYLSRSRSEYLDYLAGQAAFEARILKGVLDPYAKINLYGLNLLKQLHAITSKHCPGFVFAANEVLAPIKTLQRAFVEGYGISYTPHIIHPGYLSAVHPTCYYSLSTSSLLANLPEIQVSNLVKLKGVRKLLGHGLNAEVGARPQYDYLFFHPAATRGVKGFIPLEKLASLDTVVSQELRLYQLPFPAGSPFLRGGCIAIQHHRRSLSTYTSIH
jgi:hypothetical protein